MISKSYQHTKKIHLVDLQSVKTLLRLLLCSRTHLVIESGIGDLETGNTINCHVEDGDEDKKDD